MVYKSHATPDQNLHLIMDTRSFLVSTVDIMSGPSQMAQPLQDLQQVNLHLNIDT